MCLIYNEHREAISGLNHKKKSRDFGDEGISLELFVRKLLDKLDGIRMDLAKRNAPEGSQSVVSVKVLLSPVFGPETVNKKRNILEPWDREITRKRFSLHLCLSFISGARPDFKDFRLLGATAPLAQKHPHSPKPLLSIFQKKMASGMEEAILRSEELEVISKKHFFSTPYSSLLTSY